MVYICDMQLYSYRHSHLDMMALRSIRDNSTPMVNMIRSMLEDTRFTVYEGEERQLKLLLVHVFKGNNQSRQTIYPNHRVI